MKTKFSSFWGYFEDYAQFSPHLSVYAFELNGMKPKTDFLEQNRHISKIRNHHFWECLLIEKIIKKPRPDGSNEFGFPSCHLPMHLQVLPTFYRIWRKLSLVP